MQNFTEKKLNPAKGRRLSCQCFSLFSESFLEVDTLLVLTHTGDRFYIFFAHDNLRQKRRSRS